MTNVYINPIYGLIKPDGYYVYTHHINGRKEPFYVGKGKLRRGWETKSRTKEWFDVASGSNVSIKIVQHGMTEDESLRLEEILIHHYRQEGIPLCNKAKGGVKGGGWKHTDESKRVMSEKKSGENNYYYGRKLPERTRKIMSILATGEGNPFYGKKLTEEHKSKLLECNSGKNNKFYNHEVYDFYHKDHGKVSCTQNELRVTYNLKHPGVSFICSGKQIEHYGWRLYEMKDAVGSRPKKQHTTD